MKDSFIEVVASSGGRRLVRTSAITHIIEFKRNVTGLKVNGDSEAMWIDASYDELVTIVEKADG